ncbi:CD1247 N-terminal domain-containing protein [uncultured Clostridium sp.]|uniref:CD1247 N-terminal domain-containing protein n=1 Tax=uncultured Clostridium sp. TaxID=59620 RepID=UPI0028EE4D00|nr:CD1247 N-terminal domain-containing protein [uncultured Clostridium sp.]
MSSISSKVSYLNGLIDGLGVDEGSKEGKIIKEMVGILQQIGEEMEEVKDSQKDMQEYIDVLDEDLNSLEDELYDDEDYEDIDDFIDMTCENCGETIYVDSNILQSKENIACPNCHKDILLSKNCCGHEEDCDC